MVLGLRSKSRKSVPIQVDYLIHVQEVKPWTPSQSLKSSQSVLLQWENGDHNSGSFSCGVGDGKIGISESFRLPITLCQEVSRKGTGRENFQKNSLEFCLYEPRKDKAVKGQLLGSAVINLADYGIIKESLTISAQLNCKRGFKSSAQPVLYVNIQPINRDSPSSSSKGSLSKEVSLDKEKSESVSQLRDSPTPTSSSKGSLSKEVSLDKDRSESFLQLANEGEDEEAEIASFTDEEDDDVSSHSSRTITSSALETTGSSLAGVSPLQSDQYKSELAKDWVKVASFEDKEKKEQQENGQEEQTLEVKKYHLEDEVGDKFSDDAARKQVKFRNDTLSFSRNSLRVQESVPTTNKLRQVKSVQFPFHSSNSSVMFGDSQLMEQGNNNNIPEATRARTYSPEATSARTYSPKAIRENKATISSFSDGKVELESKSEILEEELREAAAYSPKAISENKATISSFSDGKVELESKSEILVEELREAAAVEVASIYSTSESKEMTSSFSDDKVELKSKIETLEEELREAAAVEVSLYSVVAEHGSSAIKVHAPARRLSRFYLHACKARSPAKRASAARTAVSGLVLVAKACGNDVPRLTFWLSNSILLRAIISQAVDKLQLSAGPNISSRGGGNGLGERSSLKQRQPTLLVEKKNNAVEYFDDWEDPQTFIVALENVETWIFNRITESVWWQTLTPHMQSAAAKCSGSRKTHGTRYGIGDQEQGNFSIDLWKRAFKDACERLCPLRAGGHECGCLPVLARLVMEQLVARLDVAMFNAILRESAEEMPTDPVSDPISDSKVLPIPAGKSSFGSGAQLKNAIGNWSRWLTDLFDIDDSEGGIELDGDKKVEYETSFKVFHLLNALSDLMMLPFEMLADRSIRKEVCPSFDASLIKRVLYNFVPDEFCPDPIPEAVFEALDSEDLESEEDSFKSFPCIAAHTIYQPPPAASLTGIIGEVKSRSTTSGSSVLRKSYTSDDELDELDSPISSIVIDNFRVSPTSAKPNLMLKKDGDRKVVRYQLLREVWRDGE
nr:uncharacterized protein LOC112015061 [Quercus suber]POE46687.1 hypothetical protein CFP56_65725 [Quercus suber]